MDSARDHDPTTDAVRVEAHPESLLWCCHIRSSDDVYPTRSYEEALRLADMITERFDRFDPLTDPHRPLARAMPAPWPGSASEHAVWLPASIADWNLDAGTTERQPEPREEP